MAMTGTRRIASIVLVIVLASRSAVAQSLANAIAAVAPNASTVRGDRFASVATGLGVHARRVFAGPHA